MKPFYLFSDVTFLPATASDNWWNGDEQACYLCWWEDIWLNFDLTSNINTLTISNCSLLIYWLFSGLTCRTPHHSYYSHKQISNTWSILLCLGQNQTFYLYYIKYHNSLINHMSNHYGILYKYICQILSKSGHPAIGFWPTPHPPPSISDTCLWWCYPIWLSTARGGGGGVSLLWQWKHVHGM